MGRRKVNGNQNLLRMVNRSSILHLLEHNGVTSRVELAALSGLSAPTVSAVIKELADEGWVNELGDGVSRGGKPPQLIRLNSNARMIAAVRITADAIETRISNLANTVIQSEVQKPVCFDVQSLCQTVSRSVVQMIHQSRTPWEKVLGVCISVPGVVDQEGNVSNAPELGWDQAPIATTLRTLLDCDVLVENDVKLCTLGEAWNRQLSKGTMVYMHLDRGIGAGILINGQVHKGSHFAAGEIGSLIVSPKTLETETPSSEKSVTEGPFEYNFGLQALIRQEPGMDATAHETRILQYLTYGFANVISVLDPDIIVFGGEMTTRVKDFSQTITSLLSELPVFQPQMFVSNLGSEACFIGATRYVLDNFRDHVALTSV